MKVRFLVIFLPFVFAIVSCQREVDGTIDRTTNPVTNDSIYLKQYVEKDITAAPGSDTIYKYDFYYDNAKRISGYLLTEYNYNPLMKSYTDVKYYYNGNDTLPFKTTMHIQDAGLSYLDTTFYFYSNGKVAADSIIFYRENNHELLYTNSTNFTPSGVNVFVRIRRVNYLPGTPIVSVDSGLVNITTAGGNISTQTSPIGLLFGGYSNFTYDNKVNPFYRIDTHYPVMGFSLFDVQKNNFLSDKTGSDPSNLYYHFTITYTYRSDGYPVTLNKTDLLDPADTGKGFFYYTK